MFKASLQRHARLGNVARRQLSTLASRQIRSRPLIASCQRWSQAELQSNPLKQVAERLYSYESTAARPQAEVENSAASSGRVTRFADLSKLGVHENIVRAITQGMKYETMTEVQSLTIKPALQGVDLVAQAKTGTGKTLGFLIPVFQRMLAADPGLAQPNSRRRASPGDIRAIILSPTRELAEQIGVEARKLARNTSIVVQTAVGGTQKRQSLFMMQRQGCDLLVATPGRLQDILSDPSSGVAAPRLQSFVLDEADRMLDVGFSEDIRNLLNMLPPIEEVDRQTLLYSATIPRDVVHLAKSLVKTNNFEFVQTIDPNEAPTHERVPQHLSVVQGYENWFPAVLEIADQAQQKAKADPNALPFKAIVFFSNTATVQFAAKVFKSLSRANGLEVYEIHSKLSQYERTRSAENFRRSESGILVSSDVTARGMDFPNVSHVIQVGLPPDRDQYIHRVGRTGRAGNPGEGWLILTEKEVAEARGRLPGLPIKPNTTLVSATHIIGKTETPEASRYFEVISEAYKRVPRYYFKDTYTAILGQKFGRRLYPEDVVELLNNWCFKGLGWEEQPSLTPKSVANRGLGNVSGIKVGFDDDKYESRPSTGRGFGRGDFGRGDFGRGGSDRGDFGRGGSDRGDFGRGGSDRGTLAGEAPTGGTLAGATLAGGLSRGRLR
ncbi:hypothetical protein AAE478_001746 [Parahypoxylon ruwenzoriense]